MIIWLQSIQAISTMRVSAFKYLFKRSFILLLLLVSKQAFLYGITLYSYQSGNWDNVDTWTTDPGGTTLVGSQVPGNNDAVVILSSRTVTLTSDVTTTGLDVTINSGGILEQGMYRFTSSLTALHGQGRFRLSTGNFPVAATNTFITSGGGTVEYHEFTGTLVQDTYNHLKFLKTDNTATSYTITIGSELTVNGDFSIMRSQGTGNVTAVLGNSAVTRNVSIAGDFYVSAGGLFNIGNFNAIHTIRVGGDFTNYGSVDLSNSAQYTTANNGAAVFTFTGESDNDLRCEGITDFYRLILDKGTDRTFVLTVTASNASYFSLFGPVTATGGDWSTLPLVLQNGTLRLRSAVTIPVLGENTGSGTIREFHIPGSAGLWIDGANVSTADGPGGWSGITVYGLFRITSGTFTNPNGTGGITYFGNVSQPGYILIEGGTVNTTQVKQADVNGRVTYHQTGGSLRITGSSDSRGSSAVFALPNADFVYSVSGGSIYISGVNTTATNGIDIRVSSSNYNVTGGTVTIVRPSAADDQTNFHIYSTAPFYDLILKDTTAAGTNLGFQLQNPLTVLNDLSVQNRTLNAGNHDVTVGGDFTVSTGAVYTPGTNTTTFDGSGNNTFFFNGTITSGLNNIIINKPSGSVTFLRSSPGTLAVRGTFDLTAGTFDDGGNTINVSGNITNSGIHSGTGLIALTGTDPQTIGGNGNGIFQNLSLNNTDGTSYPVSLTAGITINGTLALTSNKIFQIGNNNLNLTATGSISGTFSATRFIATNGDIGDRGITKTMSTNSFTFPIGVIPGTVRYTPTTITLSTSPTTYGSVTVFPVDAEQMQTSPNGRNRSLTYFWRVSSSGFVLGAANVSQTFTYAQGDVVTGNPQISENSYVPARYNPATYSWNKGTTAEVDETNNIINWPNNVNYIDGDYTAGDDTPQDPFGPVTVLYSYQSGTWRGNTTWMTDTTDAGSVTPADPDSNTPVLIRNGHTVTIDGNNQASGNLQIQAAGVLDCIAYTGLNFGVVTNPLNGSGKIRISRSTFPSGDFTLFRGVYGGTVEYYTPAGSSFTIPTTSASGEVLNYYRHLMLTPATTRFLTTPDIDLTIYGDMTVQGQSASGMVRLNTVNSRTISITGNLAVASGNLQFRNGQSQTLSVNGNVEMSTGAIFDVQATGTTTNTLTIYGNLINNGTLNFNNFNSCDITFAGSTSASLTGTGNTTLRNITVNKGSSQATLLTVDVSGTTFSTPVNDWLTLLNGTFRFMRTGNLRVTTTSAFTVPTTAGLYVNHSGAVVYIGDSNSNTNDLYLDGKMTLITGTVYIGPAAAPAYNNDIEYSASGNSALEIQGGSLVVNGQIRRSLTGTGGVLLYTQTGGSVTIHGNNLQPVRAKLEIENDGSVFTMSDGSLTIIRGGGTTFGDLYLRPASGSVTGGTIQFGTMNVGIQTLLMDATLALNHLTINGNGTLNTLQLMVNTLALNGNLTISNANSAFNANNINVSLKGNFTNNGTYTPGTNTTTFKGTVQTIEGTTQSLFSNLVIDPSTSVTLSNNITINSTLILSGGTFSTDTYTVHAKGDVINTAVHSGSSSAGGITLDGTVVQSLSGNGTYGRLELNNTAGARILNNIRFDQDFLLTSGVLDINQNLLTLGENCDIIGSGFGMNKMIMPDGVFSNIGIRKYLGTGSGSFTYPLGVAGKYTPAVLTIDANGSAGSVRVNVINDNHPTASDPDNILQYYWEVESSGISGFEGHLQLQYVQADVRGSEDEYVAARLIVPPGNDWSKAATGPTTDNVDESVNNITFEFPAGTSTLGGEYTAGTDAAIPNTVPTYTSNTDGNWDDVNIWTPVAPAGGPNGFIVIISSGDSVSTNGNRRFAYRTTINGTLDVSSTYGHNLGTVDGTGKLFLTGPQLPAGRFTSFFNCAGGTLEYGGTSDYTVIADRIDTIRNLYFTGTGNRVLPDKDLVICELLRINGPNLDNSAYNRKITLFGGIERLNTGTFNSGTGVNATVVFQGISVQQSGGAAGNFTGSNAFNNMEMDNLAGLILNGPMELNGNLLLTNGVINTSSANILSMLEWSSGVTPAGGSSSAYISGPFSKRIFEGDDFIFPTGKGTRYGKISLYDAGDGTWQAEYFSSGYSSLSVTAPLTEVSASEYWHVTGPAGKQAFVELRWDALSDITPLTTQNGLTDIRVAEFDNGTTSWTEKGTLANGDDFDGTASTTAKMNLDEHDYTLASVSALKPRAGFTNTSDVCVGDDLFVAFTKTAASYTFSYSISGGTNQEVTTSANPYTLVTSVTGRYKLVSFTGGVVDTNSVWVRPVPVAGLISDDADNAICEGQNITFTAAGGDQYTFYVDGSLIQQGVSNLYSTSLLTNGSSVHVVVTNTEGCSDVSAPITITVYSLPLPSLTGSQSVCTEAVETYTTESGMSNYSWNVTGGTVSAGGTNTDNSVTVTWTTLGSQSVSVNYENEYGCSADTPTGLAVEVYRCPQTGPAYYIPNDFNE